jgi:glycosyltransferase involved in cell wall biosynthesis
MTVPITVVIPVGPRAEDCAFLAECLDSVARQTAPPGGGVLLVDDMHNIGSHPTCKITAAVVYNHWNLGVAASFNTGVGVAETEHVALLGADDWLEPTALECAQRAIERHPYEQAYYYWHVRYNDDRPNPDQGLACGAAVVTKKLWAATGGFPVEAAVGRSDTMLVGLLMNHPEVGTLVEIDDGAAGRPVVNVRIHAGQHTASRGPWIQALEATAQAYWTTWERPAWGRTI